MITFAVLAFVVAGAIWLAVFIYTPLRNLLPARFTVELRDRYNEMDVRLDSIADATRIYQQYTSNIRSILTDSVAPAPASSRYIPDIQDIPVDSLLTASDREKMFVRSFEDEERFNLSVLSPIAADGMTFFAPVSGLGAEITEGASRYPQRGGDDGQTCWRVGYLSWHGAEPKLHHRARIYAHHPASQ